MATATKSKDDETVAPPVPPAPPVEPVKAARIEAAHAPAEAEPESDQAEAGGPRRPKNIKYLISDPTHQIGAAWKDAQGVVRSKTYEGSNQGTELDPDHFTVADLANLIKRGEVLALLGFEKGKPNFLEPKDGAGRDLPFAVIEFLIEHGAMPGPRESVWSVAAPAPKQKLTGLRDEKATRLQDRYRG